VQQLCDKNVVIVAGYAAGVDQAAHRAALRSGGETIAVLAEGILNFSVRTSLAGDWDWNRSLVVSQYLPNARWAIAKAMQRNRTIIGLSRALVVIEARLTGGTYEAGQSALALQMPLFAPIYESIEATAPGNQVLISRGAVPIMKSKSTGRAKVTKLVQLALSSDDSIASGPVSEDLRL
jgi:DNA processing protein